MAAPLIQQYGLASDTTFILRVNMAIVAYAYTVEQELSSVTNHVARLTLANKIVQAATTYAPVFAALIAAVDSGASTAYVSTNPPLQANVLDATIISDVAVGWNIVAGV